LLFDSGNFGPGCSILARPTNFLLLLELAMKQRCPCKTFVFFLLAIVTACTLWQVSLRVQAQKVEKAKDCASGVGWECGQSAGYKQSSVRTEQRRNTARRFKEYTTGILFHD